MLVMERAGEIHGADDGGGNLLENRATRNGIGSGRASVPGQTCGTAGSVGIRPVCSFPVISCQRQII